MDNHEFGIMKTPPTEDGMYECYEPKKYNCISVSDDYIQPLLEDLSELDCYWHSLSRPEKNLAYTGITLIPPSSLNLFISLLGNNRETDRLKKLFIKARDEEKFVIHFGL